MSKFARYFHTCKMIKCRDLRANPSNESDKMEHQTSPYYGIHRLYLKFIVYNSCANIGMGYWSIMPNNLF